nr:AAA family ATPase [uncultured Senegalimassilia sp.]
MAIDHIEVVERDPHSSAAPEPQPVESRPEIEPTPIRSYRDKKPVKHVVGQTKIMAIINQKGGVGKSTTAINLSAALGELGKQVLLVDLDPQGNSSSGLGVEKSQVQNCIYDVLLNDVPVEEVIIPDVCEGLDLVPATINLAGAEVELVSEMARENRLKDAIGALRGKYDYIFIDCPPSLGLLTVNALVAADKLLIPIQCEFYALEGVTKLLDSMKRVKTRLNPTLDIYGVLMTMYDGRTTLSRQVVEEVRSYFGRLVFETLIPRTVKLSEAPSFGQPITLYDPSGKGAQSYMSLAKEVIARG